MARALGGGGRGAGGGGGGGGGVGRGRASAAPPRHSSPPRASSPSAVVLALASGGDAATVEAPARDPRGQRARRLLLAVAVRGAVAAAAGGGAAAAPPAARPLAPPRGVRPPRLSFECRTLLAGRDAAAYLSRVGAALPPMADCAGGEENELVVNVGDFEAVGAVFEARGEDGDEGGGGGEKDDGGGKGASSPSPPGRSVVFSETARLCPSDLGYDPDFDS